MAELSALPGSYASMRGIATLLEGTSAVLWDVLVSPPVLLVLPTQPCSPSYPYDQLKANFDKWSAFIHTLRKEDFFRQGSFSAARCHFRSLAVLRTKLSGFMFALRFCAQRGVRAVFARVCGGHSILHKQCQGWLISQGLCLLASLNGRP